MSLSEGSSRYVKMKRFRTDEKIPFERMIRGRSRSSPVKSEVTLSSRSFSKRDSSASGLREENEVVDLDTYVGGMSEIRSWCAVVDDTGEEAGVVLGEGKTHIFQNIRDKVVLVLERSPQSVQCFIE